MNEPIFDTIEKESSDSVSKIKNLFILFFKKIHWFIFSILICLTFAYFKVKKIIPTYKASASILIKDDENSGFFQESSAFQDLDYYNSMYYPLDNEIAILRSRNIIQKVVRDLKLNVQYFTTKNEKTIELFNENPFRITYLSGDSSIYNKQGNLNIKVVSLKSFLIEDSGSGKVIQADFGKTLKTSVGNLILIPENIEINKEYQINYSTLESKITEIVGSILIEKMNEFSNVILISFVDENEFKAKAIINNLILQHQNDVIEDKNQVSVNSANFINERIRFISEELDDVENLVKNYKSKNEVFDVLTEKDLFLSTKAENDQAIIQNEMQIKLIEYINSYIENQNDATVLIPSNSGVEDILLNQNIELHNSIVLERNRVLISSSEKNPIAVNLKSKIISLQENIEIGLKRFETSLKLNRRELNFQENKLNSNIVALPRKEKELREIQRQQQIKESLYLYLLQKREETAITLALTVPNSKVIDHAFCESASYSPNKRSVFFIAFIIGLIFPAIVILLMQKLNSKITNKEDFEKFGFDILNTIPKNENPYYIFKFNENSFFAESFRLLRTNLDFLSATFDSKCKTILVTSTKLSEGKSVISINLAKSLSLTGKKTIVLGLDLRSPSLSKYIDLKNSKGVTNFIVDKELTVKSIINTNVSDIGFDVIFSGDIPPNPAELLLNERLSLLIDELKKEYDYIIIDSAPASLVTDTFLLNQFVDITLFILRCNVTENSSIDFMRKTKVQNKLENIHFILNDVVSVANYSYYRREKISFIKKIIYFFKN